MEFDEIVVKESPGLCRCCLSEGCYKDMGTEYTWMSENEVYADMLLECFDIGISQHNDGPNGPNRLICEVCITRLRDACNFKKQVLDSEKKFVDMIGRGEFRPKVLIYQSQMKAESNEEIEDTEVEYLEEDLGDFVDEDDQPLKSEDQEPSVSEVAAEPLPVPKRGRPRKNAEKPEKKRKVEERPKTSKAVVKGKIRTRNDNEHSQRKELLQLLTVITEASTIMPFRWFWNRYMCFYCCCYFNGPTELREHTKMQHINTKVASAFKKYQQLECKIKLDVADVSCKKCWEKLGGLDEFLDHATDAHGIEVNKEASRSILCFELNEEEMYCLDCDERFRYFGQLLNHVHKNHSSLKQFLCEVCGMGFDTKNHAKNHYRNAHAVSKCSKCSKTFDKLHDLTKHVALEHQSIQCPLCPEILTSRYYKKRHMALKHDVKSAQFKCDDCGKVFIMKNRLIEHRERMHLKLKNFICWICGFKVYNKIMLDRHLVCHDDARPFKCDLCKMTFRRKKTLTYHMLTHKREKKHMCCECGETFLTITSLRLHEKTHRDTETSGPEVSLKKRRGRRKPELESEIEYFIVEDYVSD